MSLQKSETPTPLLPITTQTTHGQRQDGPSNSKVEPQSPRRSSKKQSPKSSRHSSSSSRRSGIPISELPKLNIKDIEKEAAHFDSSQRHDSLVDQLCTYDTKEENALVKTHALSILIFLSCPVSLVSFANCFITVGVLFICPIILIFSFCHPERTFRDLVMQMLAPLLRWQLEPIYAAMPMASHSHSKKDTGFYSHRNSQISPRRHMGFQNADEPVTAVISLPMLVIIHLISPIVSVGVVLSTWIAAFFWFYAGIIGNPEGTGAEQRTSVRYLNGERPGEHDGRESVLTVRAWWKGWLTGALEMRNAELE